MQCANCGAPMTAPTVAGQPFKCPYCGASAAPEPPKATVGALVDRLLAEVGPDVHAPHGQSVQPHVHVIHQASFSVDGQAYSSLDQMPADARRALERGLAMMGQSVQGGGGPAAPAANREARGARINWQLIGPLIAGLIFALILVLVCWR